MKKIAVFLIIGFIMSQESFSQSNVQKASSREVAKKTQSVYDFVVEDINGEKFDFSTLKGKKIMIVNTASKCGLTPQYQELQDLYLKAKGNGLVIVAFPTNDFNNQEPGNSKEIAEFCQKNYGVTFPIMEKITVKGERINSLYKFLTTKELNGYKDSTVEWNFQKYLIDENGHLVNVIPPKVSPKDEVIMNWIYGKKK